MTFGIRSASDRGCLYVLFREEPYTIFQAYDQYEDEWTTLAELGDIPEWGSAICAWHNQNSLPQEYKVFAIPYDIQRGGSGKTGHIYEYDIPTNTWKTLDTVPHDNITHGRGLSLKSGDCGNYINLYYLGGPVPASEDHDGFWVYRRLTKPPGPRGPQLENHWDRLADFTHGYGADLAFWPDVEEGDHQMFALRGNSNLFYRYDIAENTWTPKANVPDAVHSGGSLTADGILGSDKVESNSDRLYAFRGLNNSSNPTNLFYKYDPKNDQWNEDFEPALPQYDVARGADLAFGYYDNPGGQRSGIWATFGNNDSGVGFYEPPVPEQEGGQSMASQSLPEPVRIAQNTRDQILINFSAVLKTATRLTIYDALGRLEREFQIASGKKEYILDWSKISSGIYYYRLTIENHEFKGKLVKN